MCYGTQYITSYVCQLVDLFVSLDYAQIPNEEGV